MPNKKIAPPPKEFADEREHLRKIATALVMLLTAIETGVMHAGPDALDWMGW